MKGKEDTTKIFKELDILENSEKGGKENRGNKDKLIYGNDINIKNPKRLGNLRALLYINDYPLIVIGPNCNKFY